MGEPPPRGQARLTTMVPRVEGVRQRDAAHAQDERVDEFPEVRMGGPFLPEEVGDGGAEAATQLSLAGRVP